MVRVLVVATAAVARAGLSSALSIDPQIAVVDTAADLATLAAAGRSISTGCHLARSGRLAPSIGLGAVKSLANRAIATNPDRSV